MAQEQQQETGEDFSLAPSGPIIRFFKGLAPAWFTVRHGIVVLLCITWVPLAVLSVAGGVAWDGVENPFFEDIGAHVRFLVIIPLLISGEVVFRQRIRNVVKQFTGRGLVSAEEQFRYESILEHTRRWRTSIVPELLALLWVVAGGYLFWSDAVAWTVSTWYGTGTAGEMHVTGAGYWYALIGRPVFRFVSFLWYIRLFLWYMFSFKVSRLHLRVSALHPDRAGGLGFLTGSAFAFTPLLLAHSFFASSIIADSIWHEGAMLPEFKVEVVAIVLALVLVVVLPLALFSSQLIAVRRKMSHEYGAMANAYVSDFWKKWKESPASQREPFLGSSDIQSLADLGNSYQVIKEMEILPISRRAVIQLGIMVLAPFLPLVLTMVSLEEVIDGAAKLLL